MNPTKEHNLQACIFQSLYVNELLLGEFVSYHTIIAVPPMQEHANEDVEKMILGNKCDMEDKRVISKERGETIARENGVPFLEVRCSELAHHEINSVFD